MRTANTAFRFVLELAALAALAVWGWRLSLPIGVRLAAAVGAPLGAAVAWGFWIAPKAPRRLEDPWRLAGELAVFGSAVGALVGAGETRLAIGLGVAASLNMSLLVVWNQR